MNVNQRWTELRRVIQSSARKYVGYEGKQKPKKPWITEEMINKMDVRRKWKNESNEEGKKRYRELNNELRREAAKAKETWWSRECKELEELDK